MVEVIGSTPIFSTTSPTIGAFFLFIVYILYSESKHRYYVGETDNLIARMKAHLSGISRYTAIAKDWIVVYTEEHPTRTHAIRRERQIKSMKSRKYIEELIQSQL